ncbi:Protein S40-5 [Cardamine amara subsp. amara]|uniref:Protein S40-5 n=1 Tax=Cardamine amara subsp. amara TaxID=228776 RepID=A0ABD0ZPZ9_CARAN
MARGRKLTMSQSERYLGSSYSYGDSNGNSVTDDSELTEEDIWSHAVDHSPEDPQEMMESHVAWNTRETVVRNGRVGGGLSLAFEDPSSSPSIVHQIRGGGEGDGGGVGGGGGGRIQRQLASSAPVNVPDWSKIYRVNSVESIHESEEEDDEESGMMMPPHEYLAKSQKRRSRKSGVGGGGGASVFEGVGRTLKGRELRRVRDVIWSQTGFYG